MSGPGEISGLNTSLLHASIDAGCIPVLLPLAESAAGQILNVNADVVARYSSMPPQQRIAATFQLPACLPACLPVWLHALPWPFCRFAVLPLSWALALALACREAAISMKPLKTIMINSKGKHIPAEPTGT
jgi:hypothetical protein